MYQISIKPSAPPVHCRNVGHNCKILWLMVIVKWTCRCQIHIGVRILHQWISSLQLEQITFDWICQLLGLYWNDNICKSVLKLYLACSNFMLPVHMTQNILLSSFVHRPSTIVAIYRLSQNLSNSYLSDFTGSTYPLKPQTISIFIFIQTFVLTQQGLWVNLQINCLITFSLYLKNEAYISI